jgi:HSP20 family protein
MSLIPWRNKATEKSSEETSLSSPMARFRSEMERMFERFFSDPWDAGESLFAPGSVWAPSLEVSETDKEVVVRAEVPGVDPKELDLSVTGNVLTISGEKKETSERKGESFYQTERRFGSFQRSVSLPSYVETDKVSAEHKDGVLTVRMAKSEAAKPKRISVKSG